MKKFATAFTIVAGLAAINLVIWSCWQTVSQEDQKISIAKAAGRSDIGVVTFISSLPKSADKKTATDMAQAAGFRWAREEYTYPVNDFAPYDGAYSRLKGAGFNILGLLTYNSGTSHEDWKNYVEDVVGHFGGVSAWEVMNEADNYLSASDYTSYLKEAHDIIQAKGGATVVLTGLTARKEVYPFWDGVAAAGGWDYFDVVGLHMFHDGPPGEDSYNNGTLTQEVQKVVNTINNNGGGKPIWVTELGYDSGNYGEANQANWLSESLGIVSGFGEVQKIFIFRLYDHGNGLGVVNSSFGEKPAYQAVKNWIQGGESVAQAPAVSEITQAPAVQESEPAASTPVPQVAIDKDKSFTRLDGDKIVADGEAKYRIVVGLEDAENKAVTSVKPSIVLSGGKTALTDFVLVGNEWFAYVASTEPGEITAQIKAGGADLGGIKMVFGEQTSKPSASAGENQSQTAAPTKNSLLAWYILGAIGANGLIAFFIYLVWKRHKFQAAKA